MEPVHRRDRELQMRAPGAASWALACCALAAGGASLLGASDAHAQSAAPQVDPRALLERGLTDFRNGNFRPALQSFQRTFELTGNPAILFNIAVTWQRLGEPGEAARALRRYLVAQPDARNRADIERQIHSLEGEDTHLHPNASRSNEATTGTTAPNTLSNTSSNATGAATTGSPPPPPHGNSGTNSSHPSIVAPLVVTAAGGVALVTGIVFYALREVALGDLRAVCTTGSEPWNCPDTAFAHARYTDANTFTAVSLATGIVGVLAIAGGVTWLLLPRRDGHRDTARIGFGATREGAAFTFGGSF